MPLPKSEPREPIHTRRFITHGFRRRDGLWDIEGELHDSKSYPFEMSERGTLEPGEHTITLQVNVPELGRISLPVTDTIE